jgi:hypothetical protein
MLSGFNTNVRHRGVLFHLQTEDSGRAHPHVITHLYHGGTILASEKRGYADLVQEPDLPARVRALMEEQHGVMLGRLRAGELDAAIASRLGEGVFGGAEPAASAVTQRDAVRSPEPAAAPSPAAAARAARPRPAPAPDDRPLDELVLEYLVDAGREQHHAGRARPERSVEGASVRAPAGGAQRRVE